MLTLRGKGEGSGVLIKRERVGAHGQRDTAEPLEEKCTKIW